MKTIFDKVANVQECIIETPLVEVFVNKESIGLHNEYTVRRILIAVQRKEIENDFTFLFKGKKHKIVKIGELCKIQPNFEKGFFSLSADLLWEQFE